MEINYNLSIIYNNGLLLPELVKQFAKELHLTKKKVLFIILNILST